MASAEHSAFIDTAANVIAIVVIAIVPIVLIAVFWLVHIIPEKVAEQRHHPQKEAIKVLCLLSLVFGGLLWPLAWLWAYSKPVLHQLAYGRDRHDEYYAEEAQAEPAQPAAQSEELQQDEVQQEIEKLRLELHLLAKRSERAPELEYIEHRLEALEQVARAAGQRGR